MLVREYSTVCFTREDLVTMRQSDGIHLTAAGSDRLALAVLRSVAADWGPAVLPEG